MNTDRRRRIDEAKTLLEAIDLEPIMNLIDAIREEEQEAYDNLPESFQDGDRGQAMQEAIEHLESAFSGVEDAVAQIEEAVSQLGDAMA